MLRELLDLAVPGACPGCGRPGVAGICPRCRRELAAAPCPVRPRVPAAVPVWALGGYVGARRRLVLRAKEHGDAAAREAIGATFAAGLLDLSARGHLPDPRMGVVTLVPAPTRAAAARRRGGDPVAAAARAAAARVPGLAVRPLLVTAAAAADSAELGAAARRRNLSGRVRPRPRAAAPAGPVVLVDDVLTTGATVAEAALVLASLGVSPAAALVFAEA